MQAVVPSVSLLFLHPQRFICLSVLFRRVYIYIYIFLYVYIYESKKSNLDVSVQQWVSAECVHSSGAGLASGFVYLC